MFFSRAAGPFRATQLWNDIVCHLKQTVEVKRRRVKMKTYCSCFTGAHAVDVILHRLVYEKANLANKDISRDKAIKVWNNSQLTNRKHHFHSNMSWSLF